jgi:branched-chain amino acid transport system permease protein
MGGLGRIDTTILSAFLLGEAEALIVQFISPSYVDALSFVVMLAVLLFRPRGLFGRKVGI